MSQHAWLADLQVGDTVIICRDAGQEVAHVTRVTATHVLVSDTALRFRRKDGWQPGRDFHRAFLRRYTPEAEKEIQSQRLRQKTYAVLSHIHRRDVDRLTAEECQGILTLLHTCNLA